MVRRIWVCGNLVGMYVVMECLFLFGEFSCFCLLMLVVFVMMCCRREYGEG